jgi:gliding motility-associated-like protein
MKTFTIQVYSFCLICLLMGAWSEVVAQCTPVIAWISDNDPAGGTVSCPFNFTAQVRRTSTCNATNVRFVHYRTTDFSSGVPVSGYNPNATAPVVPTTTQNVPFALSFNNISMAVLTPGVDYKTELDIEVNGTILPPLPGGRIYYHFTVPTPASPTLSNPANGATVTVPIGFSWGAVSCANAYRLQIATSTAGFSAVTGFASPIFGAIGTPNVGNVTSYSYTSSLTPGTYYWSVRSDISNYPTPRSFVIAGGGTAPDTPTGLNATANSSSQIGLNWYVSTGATSYKVFRSGTEIASPTGTSYTNNGLNPSTNYCYTVQACNASGCSGNSAQRCTTTQAGGDGTPPSAPANLAASLSGTNNAYLTWDDLGGFADYFIIERSTNSSSGFSIINSNHLSEDYTDTGLSNGTYYYRVQGCNADGCSGYSAVSQGVTVNATSSSTLTVNTTNLNFIASGIPDATVVVTSNTSWNVTVDGNPSWIGGLNWAGANNDQFSVELQPNPNTTPRTATLRVKTADNAVERVVSIVQEGASIPLAAPVLVSPANQDVFDMLPDAGLNFTFNPNGNAPSTNFRIRLNRNNGAKIIERDIVVGQNTILFSKDDLIGNGSNQLELKMGDYVHWRIWAIDPANPTDTQTYSASAFIFNLKICYRLPFPTGQTYLCTRGNNESSHTGNSRYAFDFQKLPEGAIITASRRGRVARIKQDSNEGGCNQSIYQYLANYVVIDHEDGTEALYLHIQQNGALVTQGQIVQAGTPIAKMGKTGYVCGTTGIHLHFEVRYISNKKSIPINFSDINSDNGVPITGSNYTAGIGCIANDTQGLYITTSSFTPGTGVVQETSFQFNVSIIGGNANPVLAWVKFLDYNVEIPMTSTGANSFSLAKIMHVPGIKRPFQFIVRQQGSNDLVSTIYTIDVNFNCINVQKPLIQARSAWCTDCPSATQKQQQRFDITHLIVHHSGHNANPDICNNADQDFPKLIKGFYNNHRYTQGWGDIAYHYLIAPNGVIYEGRPEAIRGTHTGGNNGNDGSIGICLIGHFAAIPPTDEALGSLHHLLAWLCSKYNISPIGSGIHASSGIDRFFIEGHKVYGRETGGTQCPGAIFFERFAELRQNVPYCPNGSHNIALSNSLRITPIGSTISNAKVFLGDTQGVIRPIGYTDENGSMQIIFDPPAQLGDTLHIRANGYEALKICLDNKHFDKQHIILPMITQTQVTGIKNPQIIIKEDKITNKENITIQLAAENVTQYQILTRVGWQNSNSNVLYQLRTDILPVPDSHSDEGEEGAGSTNYITARFISNVDTIEMIKAIDYFPINEFSANTFIVNFLTPPHLLGADVYVNGDFYGKLDNVNKSLQLKTGLNHLIVKKLGFKDKEYLSVNGNQIISLSMGEFSLDSSESKIFNFPTGDKAQSWRSMTFLDPHKKSIIEVKRYLKDWSSLKLKPQSETFEINKTGGENSTLRGAAVLDQPETPIRDSIYVLEHRGADVYHKVFVSQFGDSLVYEPESQKIGWERIPTLPALSYTLMLRQTPIAKPNVHFDLIRGQRKRIHLNQIFTDPDMLSNDMTWGQITGANITYTVVGDSLELMPTGCFEGVATLTIKASHDLYERSNSLELNVLPMTIEYQATHVKCFGEQTGSIDITLQNAVAPYTYEWSGGVKSEDIQFLKAGTYTVKVTDALGCSKTISIEITQPTKLAVESQLIHNACYGEAKGIVNLNPYNGTPPYTYLWSNGATTQDITNLPIGTYQVAVTDANGCSAIYNAVITQPDSLYLSADIRFASHINNADGAIDLTLFGGTAPFTFFWSNGAITQNLQNLPPSTEPYKVLVRDAANCTLEALFWVGAELTNIPNLITPNGDGKNDTWEPEALRYYPQSITKIFDRSGRAIFTSQAGYYPKVWDGTVNGQELPTDTYYYQIDLRDGSPAYKGFITLMR